MWQGVRWGTCGSLQWVFVSCFVESFLLQHTHFDSETGQDSNLDSDPDLENLEDFYSELCLRILFNSIRIQ